ncbi:hypothetical protein EPN28_00135 [Patescibacteria group bacterium]|nr:MAG: hypothetical protein EPN28_00135 [Patescibacteria group bacterium]
MEKIATLREVVETFWGLSRGAAQDVMRLSGQLAMTLLGMGVRHFFTDETSRYSTRFRRF